MRPPVKPLEVFVIAGEASGDFLGGGIMRAMAGMRRTRFRGVGGDAMEEAGLASLFPMEELTVHGLAQAVARLPSIVVRLRETVAAILKSPPDLLLLIDSPDFNYRVAKRVRAALPWLPIVQYVSPTVWAWRPWRAKALRRCVDHVLALFPFEPEVHRQLGGPPCTYVGHPLLERLDELRPSRKEAAAREQEPFLILVLPGSRRSEIRRLGPAFGHAVARIAAEHPTAEFILPTPRHLAGEAATAIETWSHFPRIVTSETDKFEAFRRARAALAASGTVTLELALAAVPMVAAYKVSPLEAPIARRVIRSRSVILPNLILGKNAIPEFLQQDCTGPRLAAALLPLLEGGLERRRQLEAFQGVDRLMKIKGETPSRRAARVAIEVCEAKEKAGAIAASPT